MIENKTIILTDASTLTFSLALIQFIPPLELFLETNSILLLIIGVICIFLSVYLERNERIGLAIVLATIGVSLLVYGTAVTMRIVKPFWMIEPFSSILTPLTSISPSFPSLDFGFNVPTIGIGYGETMLLVTLAVTIPIIFFALYHKYNKRPKRYGKAKVKKVLRKRKR